MHRVSVGGKGGDLQIVLFKGFKHCVDFLGMRKEILGIAMCFSGEAAAADFNGLNALRGEILAGFFKGSVLEQYRKYA